MCIRDSFIGNIQSRRIPDIVRSAALVHSLFEERHARKIDEAAAAAGKVQDVLLEVNVSGEESKGGLAPGDVRALLDICARLPHVRVRGLMTMAPQGDPAAARAVFEGLANLHAQLRAGLDRREARTDGKTQQGERSGGSTAGTKRSRW